MSSQADDQSYFVKTNFMFLIGLFAHIPLALLVAYLNKTSMLFAGIASLLILSAPTFFFFRDKQAKETSIALAVALVSFSALLIHSANGMIEMHFHVFSALGIIIILAQPVASIIALVVVAVHHIAFFFLFPASLINYQAGIHILFIHAIFAICTGVPAAYIAQKFNAYVVNVKDIVRDAEIISATMAQSVLSMVSTSKALTSSSEEEAAAMIETSATVSRLKEIATQNAITSDQIRQDSERSNDKTAEAKRTIEEVTSAIREVEASTEAMNQGMLETNRQLVEIQSVIQSISSKTGLINDIVFQTKLLSFNASIEAARAGAEGKGFAVVAIEVGKLAVQSGTSSKEISQLVDDSVKKVSKIIQDSKQKSLKLASEADDKVKNCIKLSFKCEEILNEIASQAKSITGSSSAMSAANKQQADGILEISRATQNIEVSAQQNSASALSTSEVASDLKNATDELTKTIHNLKLAIGVDPVDKAA